MLLLAIIIFFILGFLSAGFILIHQIACCAMCVHSRKGNYSDKKGFNIRTCRAKAAPMLTVSHQICNRWALNPMSRKKRINRFREPLK